MNSDRILAIIAGIAIAAVLAFSAYGLAQLFTGTYQ